MNENGIKAGEPTTGEIVQSLRCDGYCSRCEKWDGGDLPCPVMIEAADRLESQEREIERLKEELEQMEEAAIVLHAANETHWTYIRELTARAEQAEKERDAAVAVIGIQAEKLKESHVVLCNICEFEDMIGCVHKNHCDGYQLFKWRGQPQEGEET